MRAQYHINSLVKRLSKNRTPSPLNKNETILKLKKSTKKQRELDVLKVLGSSSRALSLIIKFMKKPYYKHVCRSFHVKVEWGHETIKYL